MCSDFSEKRVGSERPFHGARFMGSNWNAASAKLCFGVFRHCDPLFLWFQNAFDSPTRQSIGAQSANRNVYGEAGICLSDGTCRNLTSS